MHTQGKSVGGSGAKHRQAGPSHIPCAGARIHGVTDGALHLEGLGLTCVWRGGGSGSSGGRGLHTRPHRPPGPSSKAAAAVVAAAGAAAVVVAAAAPKSRPCVSPTLTWALRGGAERPATR